MRLRTTRRWRIVASIRSGDVMIRLAVISGHASRWQAVAARLRGVALDVAPTWDALPAGDVVLFEGPDADGIERCLQAGKYVFTLADIGLTLQANAHLSIVNPDRYLPSRQLIRQQLDAGKLGEPGLIRIHRWEPTIAAQGRDLDLVLWYMGKSPTVVYAIETPAFTQVHLGFPNGAMALLDHAHCLPVGDTYYCLSLIGSAGAAYADDHQNVQLVYSGSTPRRFAPMKGSCNGRPSCRRSSIPLPRLRHDWNRIPTWADVLAVNDAVRESLRTKQAVTLTGGRLSMATRTFRCAVLSAVKHDYVARGVASHPRFELAVVADDPQVPDVGARAQPAVRRRASASRTSATSSGPCASSTSRSRSSARRPSGTAT